MASEWETGFLEPSITLLTLLLSWLLSETEFQDVSAARLANLFKSTAIETHIALLTYLTVHYVPLLYRLQLFQPLSTFSTPLYKLHQHMLHPNGSPSCLSGTLSVWFPCYELGESSRTAQNFFSTDFWSTKCQRPGKENNIDDSPTPQNCPEELLAVISLS